MHEYAQQCDGPAIRPGQVWLIEQPSATALFPLDRGALADADVVIYDRALAALITGAMPLSAYAEAQSTGDEAPVAPLSPRALGFAAGGWRVVQIVTACAERRARLRAAADALIPLGASVGLPVQVIAKMALGGCRNRDASLDELSAGIDEFAGADPLTLVFGPLSVRYPAEARAFTANGLAG